MLIEKLGQYFVAVEDPRCSRKTEHRPTEVLVIAVCAVIACAESWDDIALYGRSKLAWLRTFLDLLNGIPSHDTFRRMLGYGDDPDQILIQTPNSLILLVRPRHKENGRFPCGRAKQAGCSQMPHKNPLRK